MTWCMQSDMVTHTGSGFRTDTFRELVCLSLSVSVCLCLSVCVSETVPSLETQPSCLSQPHQLPPSYLSTQISDAPIHPSWFEYSNSVASNDCFEPYSVQGGEQVAWEFLPRATYQRGDMERVWSHVAVHIVNGRPLCVSAQRRSKPPSTSCSQGSHLVRSERAHV